MFESWQDFVLSGFVVLDGPRAHPLLLLPNNLDKMNASVLRRSCGEPGKYRAEKI